MKQKFNRGDIVEISRKNFNFRVGERAVILNRYRNFSYEDENGNCLMEYEYEVIFIHNGANVSYIEHSDLKFVRHAGEDFIKNLRKKHEIRRKNEVNLAWIVKNWKKIRENLPFLTTKTLALRIGAYKKIENGWPICGVIYKDKVVEILDFVFYTGKLEFAEEFLKLIEVKKNYLTCQQNLS